MQIAPHILPGYTQTAEEKIIAEMERTRSELISPEPDLLKDPERFQNTKQRYGKLRENLNELRNKNTDASSERSGNRRSVLNTYLERRLFNNEFPEDAQRLETYRIYTSKGRQTNFSFSSLEYLGSNIDATI